MIFFDMEEKTYFSITKYDIWKLIGATLLMFCGLVLGVGKVGEEQTMLQKDFLDSNAMISEHPSAQKNINSDPLSAICLENEVFCQKVVYT